MKNLVEIGSDLSSESFRSDFGENAPGGPFRNLLSERGRLSQLQDLLRGLFGILHGHEQRAVVI